MPPMVAEDISVYRVGQEQLPTLHYIPDFITAGEEERLLQEVHASKAKWVQLSGRRLQNHGGMVTSKGLIPAPLPSWLQQLLLDRLPPQLLALFPPDQPPNHVLINSYQPGCGIMPHEDGPLYHPVVLILSLGSPAVLRFWRKQPPGGGGAASAPPVASLLAMPRSVLVFQDDAYTHCLHGIEEVKQELLDASVVNLAAAGAAAAAKAPTVQVQVGRGDSCGECDLQPAGQAAQYHPQQHQPQPWQQQQQLQQGPMQSSSCHEGSSLQEDSCQARITRSNCSSGCQHQQQDSTCRCVGSCQCSGGGAKVATVPAATGPVLPRQGERVSLTIRRVLKVHKALGILRR